MTKKLDMTGWTDKASKKPETVKLYEEHDYITAYGMHSDLRVGWQGSTGAIGRTDEWESHGWLQFEYLKKRGLVPCSRLLDLGCGSGRLSRRVATFLLPGNYTGLEISEKLLACAIDLSHKEGWVGSAPRFLRGDGSLFAVTGLSFDIIWAHSVFTHAPPEVIRSIFSGLEDLKFGVFYFTYKFHTEPRRSGLKQFQYPPCWFIREAEKAGLAAQALPDKWPAGQRTMKVWRR